MPQGSVDRAVNPVNALIFLRIFSNKFNQCSNFTTKVILLLTSFFIFWPIGFAVVLLVIHYLQAGCSPSVLPALQKDFPELFRSADNTVISKLTGDAPPQVKSYKSKNTQNLGELLIGFFKYYSTFNWNETISIRTGDTRPTFSRERSWTGPYIKLEDPTDGGNVTRGVYSWSEFSRIKKAFQSASTQLEQSASLYDIL